MFFAPFLFLIYIEVYMNFKVFFQSIFGSWVSIFEPFNSDFIFDAIKFLDNGI